MPVSGSTSVAAQRTIRLTTFSRADGPIAISRPSRSNSCQAGQPSTWRLPRKRSGCTGAPAAFSSVGDRGEVDDRDHLLAPRRRSCGPARAAPWAARAIRRRRTPRRTARSRRGPPASAGRRARPRGSRSGWSACGLVSSKRGAQLGEPGVPHQHQERAASGDRPGSPGRSRTGRSRWHTCGRTARSGRAASSVRGSGSGDSPFTG